MIVRLITVIVIVLMTKRHYSYNNYYVYDFRPSQMDRSNRHDEMERLHYTAVQDASLRNKLLLDIVQHFIDRWKTNSTAVPYDEKAGAQRWGALRPRTTQETAIRTSICMQTLAHKIRKTQRNRQTSRRTRLAADDSQLKDNDENFAIIHMKM